LRSTRSVVDSVSNITVDGSLKLMENGEGKSDIQYDSNETGTDTLVETGNTLILVDGGEAVLESVVLMGVLSLHLSLDDIDGVVEHGGAETGETTSKQVNDNLVWNVVAKNLLGVSEDEETDTLVSGLLQKSGDDTLVEATGTVILSNSVDSVENIFVLGLS